MSVRSGDRARANKVDTKRRLRRSQIRLLRRLATPAKDATPANDPTPAEKAE
jgi:hypothetical protein